MGTTLRPASAETHRRSAGGRKQGELGEHARLMSVALGAGMVFWAMLRGGMVGRIASLAGSALVARGASGYCPVTDALTPVPAERDIALKEGWRSAAAVASSVTISRPAEEVYRFFRDFRNLAQFMRHVVRVDVRNESQSRWVVRAPFGRTVEWNATITEDLPNARIGWRADPDSEVPNAGWIEFRRAPGKRGTEVRAVIAYEPPAGQLGRWVARLSGEEPGRQARADLRRLKQVLETGEVPTSAMRREDADASAPDAG